MESTISVAKGTFVFNNGLKAANNSSTNRTNAKNTEQPWYQAYTRMWDQIKTQHEILQMAGYAKTIAYLRKFVTSSYKSKPTDFATDCDDKITMRTAALLTGINQSDHYSFFKSFADELRRKDTSLVCILQARDCPNIKFAIETMVGGLMESEYVKEEYGTVVNKYLRRSQYSMAVLKEWYTSQFSDTRPNVTVIIPDFESFDQNIIKQLILLLCHTCRILPIVLVLGVATDVSMIHRSLSISDIGRMNLHVSQTPPSTHSLNKIFEDILLTPNCSIAMSEKVFNLLTEIFLYYDMSINSFMQSFKYCVLEHYSQGNIYSLCNDKKTACLVPKLTAADFEMIRRLPSFRKYVESLNDCKKVIAVMEDDLFLASSLPSMIDDVRAYFLNFYCALRVLLPLIVHLPDHHLGKNLRDLYGKCVKSQIVETDEFKECWKLLALMSKAALISKLSNVYVTIKTYIQKYCVQGRDLKEWTKIIQTLKELIIAIKKTSDSQTFENQATTSTKFTSTTNVANRNELKARLLQNCKQPKQQNEYAMRVSAALDYVRERVFVKYLLPHSMSPALHELFVFSDYTSIRTHCMGAPRATLYTALNNPQSYLQCSCCTLTDTMQMVPTLPDLSIAYKLHLECGRFINLFDWLQQFKLIVSNNADDADPDYVDPQMLARFLQAVSELKFLGFIKTTKRKTDHVLRLTW